MRHRQQPSDEEKPGCGHEDLQLSRGGRGAHLGAAWHQARGRAHCSASQHQDFLPATRGMHEEQPPWPRPTSCCWKPGKRQEGTGFSWLPCGHRQDIDTRTSSVLIPSTAGPKCAPQHPCAQLPGSAPLLSPCSQHPDWCKRHHAAS